VVFEAKRCSSVDTWCYAGRSSFPACHFAKVDGAQGENETHRVAAFDFVCEQNILSTHTKSPCIAIQAWHSKITHTHTHTHTHKRTIKISMEKAGGRGNHRKVKRTLWIGLRWKKTDLNWKVIRLNQATSAAAIMPVLKRGLPVLLLKYRSTSARTRASSGCACF